MILKNCTIVELHPPRVETGMSIRIDGTRVAEVATDVTIDAAEAVVDLKGKIVMPGLVCSHGHFYSGLARGIMADILPSTDFVSILTNLWWRLDRALDETSLRLSGMVSCLDAIRSGCTAVIDHHASPSCIDGSLDVLKGCFKETGLRGVECYETTDRNGTDGLMAGIEENRRFALQATREREADPEGYLVESMIGGHAPFTISDPGLEALGRLVGDTGRGFHIHIAEDRFDPAYSHRHYGDEPLKRLDDYGLVTSNSLFAHGVYLSETDRKLLNQRRAALAHNCRSNMNNGVGYNDHLGGIGTVCIGTDGIGSDVLAETQSAYFKHRDAGGNLGPGDFARFLQNGNEMLSRCFHDRFGRVDAGYKADLTILDYKTPTPLVAENLASHLVFGFGSRDVDGVMANGEFLFRDGEMVGDFDGVYKEASAAAMALWKRFDEV